MKVYSRKINPLTGLDYPDPDVIRVGDTYYMVSTTMHFMPGCVILRSYDLLHWEHAAYVYDKLDSTPAQMLDGKENIYGKGMWAASLRYHKGKFYVCFVANDTGKTYLYTAGNVEGPWEKHSIGGFYHDGSLLFEEDGRVYIAYGNRDIYLTELKPDFSGPKEKGLHRLVVSDGDNPSLGYEGTHFYKINGTYYLFFIHSLRDRWKRVEACFWSDSLEGEFTGGDVFNEDMGYCGQGIAQGGIVDTPDGKWYGILFQDRGAVGRIPMLIPVSFHGKIPVFGDNGKMPEYFEIDSTRPDYQYTPLAGSDDFKEPEQEKTRRFYGCFGFKSVWQFDHEPDMTLIQRSREEGMVRVTTDKLVTDLTQAKNILTQRMCYPGCSGEITVDGSGLQEGDYAGICALQEQYAMAAVTKRNGGYYIVMRSRTKQSGADTVEWEVLPLKTAQIRLKAEADFMEMRDTVRFYYDAGDGFGQIGTEHKLYFTLAHFTGCRFGLFCCSTKQTGGSAVFSDFIYGKRRM